MCYMCNEPLYKKVTQYMRSVLVPLVEAYVLRNRLVSI